MAELPDSETQASVSVSARYHSVGALLNSPWRITNELRRCITVPYVRILFALHGIRWGKGWRIMGMPIIQRHRQSRIVLGDNIELRSWYVANPLAPNHPVVLATRESGAAIEIGSRCGLTGVAIVAAEHITIGNWVLLGANVVVTDTDFHPLDSGMRRTDTLAGAHRPVVIEDDVFVGMNSLILKGTHIGTGSVIGAGSVVTGYIPPGVLAAGNPARVIRKL